MTLKAGTSVTDKVRLIRELGHGAMGEVWVGEHLTLKTEVAVKFVSAEMLTQQPDAHRRFSIEAASAARIKSPHVVRTFDHGEMTDGTPYIVMELLEGESLQERIENSGPLSIADTYAVVRQVGKALDATHEASIIHRDVKPHNIFLSEQQGELFIKLLDFGSAKIKDDDQAKRLTSPGILLGTPEYISRDLIMDAKSVSKHVDLWALGVVAYKCLTGNVPFQGEDIARVCKAIIAGKMKRPSRIRKELSEEYDGWFANVFQQSVELRPQDGASMATSFKAIAAAALYSTPPPKPSVQAPPPTTAPPRKKQLLAALALAALLAGGAVALFSRQRETHAHSPGHTDAAPNETSDSGAVNSATNTSVTASSRTNTPSVTPSATGRSIDLGDDDGEGGSGRTMAAEDGGLPEDAGAGVQQHAPANLISALSRSRVVIPAGSFWMGCADSADSACLDNEKPGRKVTLHSYAMDRVEVSVALYFTCVRAGGCNDTKVDGYQRNGSQFVKSDKCNWTPPMRRAHPMNCVDHTQASQFCAWVDARLPSEAEWEKGARGIDKRPFPWHGNVASCSLAVMSQGAAGCRASGTWPTGSKRAGASPYDLLNMAGNVREWVSDWYQADYGAAVAVNPTGPSSGKLRVGRGGSWGNAVGKFMRTTVREGVAPATRSIHLGFRCAHTVKR